VAADQLDNCGETNFELAFCVSKSTLNPSDAVQCWMYNAPDCGLAWPNAMLLRSLELAAIIRITILPADPMNERPPPASNPSFPVPPIDFADRGNLIPCSKSLRIRSKARKSCGLGCSWLATSVKKQKIPCYFPDKQGIWAEHGSHGTASTAITTPLKTMSFSSVLTGTRKVGKRNETPPKGDFRRTESPHKSPQLFSTRSACFH
jgi:hypothetical protein